MDNATIYCLCLHNKVLPVIKKLGYVPVGLGNEKFSKEWIRDKVREYHEELDINDILNKLKKSQNFRKSQKFWKIWKISRFSKILRFSTFGGFSTFG